MQRQMDLGQQQAAAQPDSLPLVGVSVKQAMEMTGLSRHYIWQMIKSGQLGHCRVGRRIIFLPRHLEEFLAAREVPLAKVAAVAGDN